MMLSSQTKDEVTYTALGNLRIAFGHLSGSDDRSGQPGHRNRHIKGRILEKEDCVR